MLRARGLDAGSGFGGLLDLDIGLDLVVHVVSASSVSTRLGLVLGCDLGFGRRLRHVLDGDLRCRVGAELDFLLEFAHQVGLRCRRRLDVVDPRTRLHGAVPVVEDFDLGLVDGLGPASASSTTSASASATISVSASNSVAISLLNVSSGAATSSTSTTSSSTRLEHGPSFDYHEGVGRPHMTFGSTLDDVELGSASVSASLRVSRPTPTPSGCVRAPLQARAYPASPSSTRRSRAKAVPARTPMCARLRRRERRVLRPRLGLRGSAPTRSRTQRRSSSQRRSDGELERAAERVPQLVGLDSARRVRGSDEERAPSGRLRDREHRCSRAKPSGRRAAAAKSSSCSARFTNGSSCCSASARATWSPSGAALDEDLAEPPRAREPLLGERGLELELGDEAVAQ